jgi:3-oxoacyl-[acyl-carrier-protein] synthase I
LEEKTRSVMAKDVYFESTNMICSLGKTTEEVTNLLRKSISGVALCNDKQVLPVPFFASLIQKKNEEFAETLNNKYTRLEQLMIQSVKTTLKTSNIDIESNRTLFIFSTTKGNIDILESKNLQLFGFKRAHLQEMANQVTHYFKNPNKPIVVSNACISGVLAISLGAELIKNKLYDHVVVVGGDIVSAFTTSGFQSFMAISDQPCAPYDKDRKGINLGEAAATIVLTIEKSTIQYMGGDSSNDANHISGPSRTGDGLFLAINKAMNQAKLNENDIHYISAHGTATLFNDDMESKAFNLAQLTQVPVNSFKGYWGHTLGAAGIIETIAAITSLKNNELFESVGFKSLGTEMPMNVITKYQSKELISVLKTASGFGGCNAAIVFSKI